MFGFYDLKELEHKKVGTLIKYINVIINKYSDSLKIYKNSKEYLLFLALPSLQTRHRMKIQRFTHRRFTNKID